MKLVKFSFAALAVSMTFTVFADQQLVTLNDASTFPIDDIQSIQKNDYVFSMPDGQLERYPKSDIFCAATGCDTAAQLTLNGCPTIGDMIMPVGIADYAVNNEFNMGMRNWSNIHGESSHLYSMVNPESRQFRYIALQAEGTGSGFKNLAEGKLDFVFASRRPKSEEAKVIYDVSSREDSLVKRHEHLIAYDAVRVLVHPENPVAKLSIEQLSKIFSGEITNWSEVGGDNIAIKAFIPPDNSVAYGMFKTKIMQEHDRVYDDELTTLASNRQLLRRVNSDISAIAFYAAGHRGRLAQNIVSIVDDCGVEFTADDFAIKTTEYPLAHRLYIYTHPEHTGEQANELVAFMQSDRTQFSLDKVRGIVTTLPQRQIPEDALALMSSLSESSVKADNDLANTLRRSQRLSSTIHFSKNSAELSKVERSEVGRLARYLERNRLSQTKVIVVGFASQQENAEATSLSLNRAEKVASALQELDIKADVVKGVGDIAPVACNAMTYQQHKNQRVEIWLQDKQSLALLAKQ